MIRLRKIISGGQTGVDQAALSAAIALNFECGGWCPPGRSSENGKIPGHFPLKETPVERSEAAPDIPRSLRTEWNVRDSDATLILKPSESNVDKGTEWTIKCVATYKKLSLIENPFDEKALIRIKEWLNNYEIQILNVAGPSEKTYPGIGSQTFKILIQILAGLKQNAPISNIDSGDEKKGEFEPIKSDPLPWYLGFPLTLIRKSTKGTALKNAFLVILSVLVLVLILNRFFGFRIEAGQIYLGPQPTYLGAHVTVDATAGFQNSGVHVLKGNKLRLIPEGRIHVAMDHAHNLATTVKGILVHNTPNMAFSEEQKKRYPLQKLDPSFVFYRDWCGPEGDPAYSDFLEECKIKKELYWGALLVAILPENVSARADPFEVLKSYNMTSSDLVPISGESDFIADKDGYLTFIINEAVISPYSSSSDSRVFYETLKKASEQLINDPIHQIPLKSIPLIWFSDNNGAFRITIIENH